MRRSFEDGMTVGGCLAEETNGVPWREPSPGARSHGTVPEYRHTDRHRTPRRAARWHPSRSIHS